MVSRPSIGSWNLWNRFLDACDLEIHYINIAQGDSTLIVGPMRKPLFFDVDKSNGNPSARAKILCPDIESFLGCKSLYYVVVSHSHLDHPARWSYSTHHLQRVFK